MQNLKHKLRRAAELGPRLVAAEVVRRVSQRLSKHFRRLRAAWKKTTLSTRELERAIPGVPRSKWTNHFRTRTEQRLFPGLDDLEKTAALIREHCPQAVEETITEAEALCAHRFAYLGHEFRHPPDRIDWRDNWPATHYTAIVYGAQLVPPRDIKLVWELGRFQHANALGRAFALTGDDRYAVEFFEQLASFDRDNPPEFGPHWLCAMEVAIRAMNLIVAFHLLRASSECTDERVFGLLRMIEEHARFIETNLENTHHVTSNHYLSDLAGLLFIGIGFPEFDRSAQRREFAWTELLKEFDRQVYPDGVDWEASTCYHRLVTELFLYCFLLGKENGLDLPNEAEAKLGRMFEFARACLRPDGRMPQIGDNDNGTVFNWAGRHPMDHSYLSALDIRNMFFTAKDAKEVSTACGSERVSSENSSLITHHSSCSPDALWIFGKIPVPNPAPVGSAAFPDAGVYVMREGDDYLIVDCGDNGINGHGSHAHNDALSFELFTEGRAWIVDPGTYGYTGDLEARDLFRSTAYHNTARVDGEEINPIPKGVPFALGSNVRPRVRTWKTSPDEDVLEAEHDGFARLPHPVTHQRKFAFDKREREWIIEDRFIGGPERREHTVELFFNFDAEITLTKVAGNEIRAEDKQGRRLFVQLVHATTSLTAEHLERWVSPEYGRRVRSEGAKWQAVAKSPIIVTWRVFAEKPRSRGLEFGVQAFRNGGK